MPQDVRRRFERTIEYSANNKVGESLSRGLISRHLTLQLEGAPTLTALNNSAANTLKAEEWGVVSRIDVIANGSDVIFSMSGEQLWWLNYFVFGAVPPVTAAIGDGATADPPFDSSLILPFWMPRSLRPFDTALDSRVLSDLKVEVTWGTHTSINSAATGFTTDPTLKVNTLGSFNAPAAAFSQWRRFIIEQTISAANSALRVQLPVGAIYRGFLLNTVSDSVDVGTMLDNFKLKSGTTVFADIDAEVLAVESRLMNGIPLTAARRSSSSSVNGWYYYDHVTDGRLTEGIDTLGFSEIELELNVANPGAADTIFIIPQQIIPVRAAA